MYNLLYYKQIAHKLRDPCNNDSPTLLQVIQPISPTELSCRRDFFIKISQLYK